MTRVYLPILLVVLLLLTGCGKVRLGDPMGLPGTAEILQEPTNSAPAPKFQNGDLVRYRAINNSYGVMMYRDYKYIPKLNSYYCIVDFYPSSTLSLGMSKYDNYERRYVYEYELIRIDELPRKWACLDGLTK